MVRRLRIPAASNLAHFASVALSGRRSPRALITSTIIFEEFSMHAATLKLAVSFVLVVLVSAIAMAANPLKTAPLTGTIATGGTISATLSIESFEKQGDAIVAIGTMSGTITDAAGNTTEFEGQAVTLPLTIASATCEGLNLQVGPHTMTIMDQSAEWASLTVEITPASADSKQLENILCQIAQLGGTNASPAAIAARLNKLIEELG
jgi:hypothetical protein